MFAASVLALTLASLATAAPVSSSTEEYVSTYISASDVWTSRFANATYTANATATVTVAETTVTVTYTPGVTSTSTSSWVAPSSTSDSYSSQVSSTSTWATESSSSTSEWSAPSSTSSAAAEVVTSSAAVYEAAAVKSSSSEAAWTPASSEAPAPAATTEASSSHNSGDFSGTATYYYQNGAAGSCGDYHGDGDYIVAVNAPQVGGTCGKRVVITNTKNGNTATAVCADTCPGCAYGSLDLSSGLFAALGNGDMGQGVFPITWSFA